MHRIHAGFTMAAVVKAGASQHLRTLLQSLDNNGTTLTNLNDTPSLLFFSGLFLPAETYLPQTVNERLPETLIIATTFCGPFNNHLEELVRKNSGDLIQILQHCADFTSNDSANEKALIQYLKSHKLFSAFNSRYTCISKDDVQKEKGLRNEIEVYIDRAKKLKAFNGLSSVQIRRLIQRHIITRGKKYEWAMKPAHRNLHELIATNHAVLPIAVPLAFFVALYVLYPANFLCGLVIFAIIVAALILITILMAKYISRTQHATVPRPSDDQVREVFASQLRPVLNEMAACGPLKEGNLRRYFFAGALRVIGFFAVALMKVPTVSSIRWLLMDNKKRLLFLSNYSNSTDFYVRDFLNGSTPKGVNFMFNNMMGFPDARYLVSGGISDDPEGFMNAVHTGQHVTDLWYAHEENLTEDIINKNREIRNGLFAIMNEDETRKWLQLL